MPGKKLGLRLQRNHRTHYDSFKITCVGAESGQPREAVFRYYLSGKKVTIHFNVGIDQYSFRSTIINPNYELTGGVFPDWYRNRKWTSDNPVIIEWIKKIVKNQDLTDIAVLADYLADKEYPISEFYNMWYQLTLKHTDFIEEVDNVNMKVTRTRNPEFLFYPD